VISFGSGGDAGLTPDGVQAVASDHVDVDMHRRPQTRTLHSLQDMYRSLVIREGPVATDALLEHFRPVDHSPDPSVGRYGALMANQWWSDVAREQFAAFPGVSAADGDGSGPWEFVGVDGAAFDDEPVRPLEELRADPLVRVEAALDERGVDRRSDRRSALVALVEALADAGRAEAETLATETLATELRSWSLSLDDVADDLAALPGVEREVQHPPDPSEIAVETMADVIDGYEALDQGSTEVWRYVPASE